MEDYKWFASTEKEISTLKLKMGEDYSEYKLDWLLRAAKRVSSLSDGCNNCTELQLEITKLVESLVAWPDISDEQRKNYKLKLNSIENHLRKHRSTGFGFGTGLIIVAIVIIAIIIIAVWQTCFPS